MTVKPGIKKINILVMHLDSVDLLRRSLEIKLMDLICKRIMADC